MFLRLDELPTPKPKNRWSVVASDVLNICKGGVPEAIFEPNPGVVAG
jgi:hypothetical protein